ncbi:hypothetical protein L6272_05020, partial [Microgenomates group bacterium]|nr:hypothetical protein [Microgenomates group bacterium]
ITIITVILTPKAASGQESITITAIPPRLELSALPGAILQETIKVRNESAAEMAFDVQAVDFIVNNNQGTPVAVDEAVSGRWSLASWITASPKKILLQPQETAAINLIISLPENALPGGHYAMITYNPSTEGLMNIQGSGSAIIQKVGTLIYFNVIGDITEAANLKQFQVDKPFKYYGPTAITAEIENLGDIHFNPTGNLTITNLLGKTVFSQELEAKNIFPFASRLYNWEFPGKYHLGRYTAKLEASAGNSQIPINGLIYFWIVPMKELAAALIVLAIIILLIALKKRQPTPTPPVEPTVSPEPENIA